MIIQNDLFGTVYKLHGFFNSSEGHKAIATEQNGMTLYYQPNSHLPFASTTIGKSHDPGTSTATERCSKIT